MNLDQCSTKKKWMKCLVYIHMQQYFVIDLATKIRWWGGENFKLEFTRASMSISFTCMPLLMVLNFDSCRAVWVKFFVPLATRCLAPILATAVASLGRGVVAVASAWLRRPPRGHGVVAVTFMGPRVASAGSRGLMWPRATSAWLQQPPRELCSWNAQ